MIKINDNEYEIVYIDTNIIRNIVSDEEFRIKFLKNFAFKKNTVISFSIYNIIELKPYDDLFSEFKKVFSIIPCLFFATFKEILENQYKDYIAGKDFIIDTRVMYPVSNLAGFNKFNDTIDSMFNNEELVSEIQKNILEYSLVAIEWNKKRNDNRNQFEEWGLDISKERKYYNDNFIRDEYESTKRMLEMLKINISEKELKQFPSIRLMHRCFYYKAFLTQKVINSNDVLDTMLSCIVPYVDIVCTENQMGEIFRSSSKWISQLNKITIYKICDINKMKK